MDLQDKIIWITGSGRGIGRAIALELGERGARVVVSARTNDEIEEVAKTINDNDGQALAVRCDVRNRAEIDTLTAHVKEYWGPIDMLINNAGIGVFKRIIDLEEEEWDNVLDSNLKSAFLCTRAVLPDMLERKSGHILNMVSVAGTKVFPQNGAYCASKFGMLGFNDVLREETREHGIKVTALIPGATQTDIWGKANVDFSAMMKPEDVAQMVLAICAANESAHIEQIVMRPQQGDL